LSDIAVRAFFAENDLDVTAEERGDLIRFASRDLPIEIYCGDYFRFSGLQFAGLYDRGALVALTPETRPQYVAHTKKLLKDSAFRLVVTLEYKKSIVAGPPYSVTAAELAEYWDDLRLVEVRNDLENCPPKFRAAGLKQITENFFVSPV
jgi:thiopurine S-methyltransferase